MPETSMLTEEEKGIVKSLRKELKKVASVLSKGKYNFRDTLLQLSSAHDVLKDLKITFLTKLNSVETLDEKKIKKAFGYISKAEAETWKCFNGLSGVGQLTHDGKPQVYIQKIEAIILELDKLVSPIVAKLKEAKNSLVNRIKKPK